MQTVRMYEINCDDPKCGWSEAYVSTAHDCPQWTVTCERCEGDATARPTSDRYTIAATVTPMHTPKI